MTRSRMTGSKIAGSPAACSHKELATSWLDGELPDQARAAFEEHLESCQICREEVNALRRLLAAASRLPRNIEPPRDLWPAIEAGLASRNRSSHWKDMARRASPHSRGRNSWLRGGLLVAATIAMAVLAVGIVIQQSRESQGHPPGEEAAAPPLAKAAMVESESLESPATILEAAFGTTLRQLSLEVERQGHGDAAQGQETVFSNLRIIEGASAEIRSALREHPSNRQLQRQLLANYEKQVELLALASRLSQMQPSRT